MEWLEGNPPIGAHWLADTVAELKTKPGTWAIARRYHNPNTASDAVQKLRRKGCDARTELVKGEHLIYARWPK